MELTTVILIVFGVLLGIAAFVIVQLTLQSGRLLVRIEELEGRIDVLQEAVFQYGDTIDAEGLPLRTRCIEFELPALSGENVRLTDLADRPLVLIFFDPDSIECQALLPELAAISRQYDETRPLPVIISTGPEERNRELFDAYGIDTPILIQEHDEAAERYHVDRTPSAYLVDAQGHTANTRVAGADGILYLLMIQNDDIPPDGLTGIPSDTGATTPYPDVGSADPPHLFTGDPAPDFRLPLLDGVEVRRDDYAGKRLLLVFGDPACGPCLELLPDLNDLATASSPEFAVLLVSRQDEASNRKMVEDFSLGIPVALQDGWSTSEQYGPRKVPAGCLIDHDGSLATELHIGKRQLQSLLRSLRPASG